MTPITTARPTIVRTMLPPEAPTCCGASALSPPDTFSGVCSPSAATARAGASSTPERASADVRTSAARSCIPPRKGRPWIGVPPAIGRSVRGLSGAFEAQLVDHGAREQDQRQHVEPDEHDQDE